MSGPIDLEYPFVSSWIWETEPNTVWVSMVIVDEKERNKGHTTKLIDKLLKKYKTVIVPNPSDPMKYIIEKKGFVTLDDNTWINKRD